MSDSQDPYDTPPTPDRFGLPSSSPPEPLDHPAPASRFDHPVPAARFEGPFQATPFERYDSHRPAEEMPGAENGPVHAEPARIALGEPLPSLEPLPAMAGHFGAGAVNSASDSGSLSGRLADEFVAWLKTLASAAVYATLIVTFGFQVARVEGQSMAPTLQDQDRLIVNKFAYLSAVGEPKVGDIVMLYYPNNPDKSFVKRVIAHEHQRVRIVNGKVFRDDVLVDDAFVPDQYRSHEDWGPEVVPEGYYFVMGDHRNNSSDSRHWGYVPKKYIIGRVQLRWWPVPDARTF